MNTLKEFCKKYLVEPKKTVLDFKEQGAFSNWVLYFDNKELGICLLVDKFTSFEGEEFYEFSFTTSEAFSKGTVDFGNQGATNRVPMKVRGYILDFLKALRNDPMMSFMKSIYFQSETKRERIYKRALKKDFVCREAKISISTDTVLDIQL